MSSSSKKEYTKDPQAGAFTKELYQLMYAFGDSPSPLPSSVALLETLLIQYLTETIALAMTVNSKTVNTGKLRQEDLLFIVRKDEKKRSRVEELLFMSRELQKARRAFEMDEGNGAFKE